MAGWMESWMDGWGECIDGKVDGCEDDPWVSASPSAVKG